MCIYTQNHLSSDLLQCVDSGQCVSKHSKHPNIQPQNSEKNLPQVVMGEIHGKFLGDKLEVLLEDVPGVPSLEDGGAAL